MNAEERLQRIKDLAKARAKKHYEAKKGAIAERRKQLRATKKATVQVQVQVPVAEPEAPKPRKLNVPIAKEKPRKLNIRIAKPKITQEQAEQIIKEKIKSEGSQTLYTNTLRKLTGILNCKDYLESCFKNADTTIESIENA